jgi:predicted SAM-dependent methyltransferase
MRDTSPLRDALRKVRPLVVVSRGTRRAVRRLRARYARTRDAGVITRYLDTHAVAKIQIGAGPNPLAGWLNTDVAPEAHTAHRAELVFLNASKGFPLADMSFDYVWSEHMIEHIPVDHAHHMLRECFRILRPGGRIRIATPDLAAITALYDDPLSDVQRHYVEWVSTTLKPGVHRGSPRCFVVNQMFRAHGHQFIYDQETLSAMLADVGFVAPTRWQPGESDDPELRGIESHGRALGDEDVNRLETMVLQATRPGD